MSECDITGFVSDSDVTVWLYVKLCIAQLAVCVPVFGDGLIEMCVCMGGEGGG